MDNNAFLEDIVVQNGRLYLDMLKTQYDVIGGYDYAVERVRRERYEIQEILTQSMIKDLPNGHAYRIRAQRRRIYMLCIKDDNHRDELPVFMVKLANGNVVTCYSCEQEELAMDEIAERMEEILHEGGEVI